MIHSRGIASRPGRRISIVPVAADADSSETTSQGANVKKSACMLTCIFFAWGQSAIADEFEKVRCDSDIPKAMIGQGAPNERVAVLEKKYRALGLKDLGGDEISDRLSSVNWLICGAEFISLVDRSGVVRDVLPFTPHSKRSPAFSGICQVKGQDLPDIIVAILDGVPAADYLPVQVAWKIDQQRAKFVKVSIAGLVCPRRAIYTIDGGP